MIDISASSEVIEQIISEEKKDIKNASRAESIKKVQQFILDKQEVGLDEAKINNKRYSIIRAITLVALIVVFVAGVVLKQHSATSLGYEVGCIVLVLASLYYTLVISNNRKELEDAYAKTNQAVSFKMISRADEVLRVLIEERAYRIADAEELVNKGR